MKKCPQCQEEKSLSNFSKATKNKDGLQYHCKSCQSLWAYENKDKREISRQKWITKNPIKSKKNAFDRHKKWALIYPDRLKKSSKNTGLKRLYGITLEQKQSMLVKQNSCCAWCKIGITEYLESQKDNKIIHDFAVDHNHETGQIRGLLCNPCNRALGLLKENVQTFKNGIDYLNHYNSIPTEQSNIIPLFKKKG